MVIDAAFLRVTWRQKKLFNFIETLRLFASLLIEKFFLRKTLASRNISGQTRGMQMNRRPQARKIVRREVEALSGLLQMNEFLRWGVFIGILLFCVPLGTAQSNPNEYFQNQVSNYIRALHDPAAGARVRKIWFELVTYSEHMYPVVPSQQFNAGQALPNGVILLDLSIAADDNEEVTAFFLAHEWGHQILGHPYMSLSRYGQYIMAISGTAAEDAADRYSAKFLKANSYDVQPVLNFLCSAPDSPGDSHSKGAVRAKNVARIYGSDSDDPCGSSDNGRTPTERSGRNSPGGHWEVVACTHPAHPAGDAFPCTHVCYNPWGMAVPCHQFDLYPCSHPAHPSGDRIWVPE